MLSWPPKSSVEESPTRYRLVALDLDSTLQPDGSLHSADMAAVRTAHAAGIKVVLVSSNPPQVIHRYWAQLGLGTPVIALNGALVYDYPTHKHVLGQKIEADEARRVIEIVRRVAPRSGIGLECGDTWATNRLGIVAQWQIKQTGMWPAKVGNLDAFLDRTVYEIWVDAAIPKLEVVEAETAASLTVMRYTDPDRLLLRSPGASRGWALSALAGLLEIGPHELMAIGGSGGDRSMLQAAALSLVLSGEEIAEGTGDADSAGIISTGGLAEALARYLELGDEEESQWAPSEP